MDRYREIAFENYEKILGSIQGRSEKDIRLHFALFRKNLLPHLPKDKQASILDLGTGFGDLLAFLEGEGYTDVLGVDLSPINVAYIRKRGLKATQGECLEFLKGHETCFDSIILYDVLEHQKKDDGLILMEQILKSLKPGGRVFIVVPNMSNPLTAGRGRYVDITHEVGYTQESLKVLLDLAGFATTRIVSIDHFVLPNPILNLARRLAQSAVHAGFRILFLLHGITTTTVFSKNMLAISGK